MIQQLMTINKTDYYYTYNVSEDIVKKLYVKRSYDDYDDSDKIRKQIKTICSKLIKNNYQIEQVFELKTGDYGRLWVGGDNSNVNLQNCKSIIRNTLLNNTCYDLDIVNCTPTLIYNICKSLNKDKSFYENTLYYINNRESIFNDLTNNNDLTKETVKEIIIKLFNGCSKSTIEKENKFNIENNKFLNDLYDECKNIRKLFQETFKDDYNKIVEHNKIYNKSTSELTCFTNILNTFERIIIQNIIEFLESKKFKIVNIVHDGLNIIKDNRLEDTDYIGLIEKYIKDKTNFDIKLKIKPMDKVINLDDVDLDNVEITDDTTPICINWTPYDFSKWLSVDLKGKLAYNKTLGWFYRDQNTKLFRTIEKPTYIIVPAMKRINTESINIINKLEVDDVRKKKLQDLSKQRKQIDTGSFCSQINEHLKCLMEVQDIKSKLYLHPGVLAFRNGWLDMKTKQLNPYTENDFYLENNIIDWDYDSNVSQDDMDFITNSIPDWFNNNDELYNYFHTLFGYTMSGLKTEEIVGGLVGQTAGNGKSKLTEIIQAMLPCYTEGLNKEALELSGQNKHKHLIKLWGSRFVYVSELSKNKEFDIEIIKQLSGDKELGCQVLYKTESEKIGLSCVLFFITNHTPNLPRDEGLVRRYCGIPMEAKFLSQNEYNEKTEEQIKKMNAKIRDTEIVNKFLKRRNAFYKWLLDGFDKYLKNGLIAPECVKDENEETFNCTNEVFESFFDKHIIEGINEKTSTKELKKYLENNNIKISWSDIRDGLKKKYIKYNKNTTKKVGNETHRGVFIGIKLNEEHDDDE